MARVAAFGLLCLTAGASAARVSPSALQLRSCAQAVVAEQKSSTMEWGAGLGPNAAAPLAGAALAGMLNAGVNKLGLRLRGGAKSKNHTNHNQNRKAHRNGIKRVKTHRHETTKYRAIKMWRNTKYARKGSMRIHRHSLQVKKEAAVVEVSDTEGAAASSAVEAEAEPADATTTEAYSWFSVYP